MKLTLCLNESLVQKCSSVLQRTFFFSLTYAKPAVNLLVLVIQGAPWRFICGWLLWKNVPTDEWEHFTENCSIFWLLQCCFIFWVTCDVVDILTFAFSVAHDTVQRELLYYCYNCFSFGLLMTIQIPQNPPVAFNEALLARIWNNNFPFVHCVLSWAHLNCFLLLWLTS